MSTVSALTSRQGSCEAVTHCPKSLSIPKLTMLFLTTLAAVQAATIEDEFFPSKEIKNRIGLTSFFEIALFFIPLHEKAYKEAGSVEEKECLNLGLEKTFYAITSEALLYEVFGAPGHAERCIAEQKHFQKHEEDVDLEHCVAEQKQLLMILDAEPSEVFRISDRELSDDLERCVAEERHFREHIRLYEEHDLWSCITERKRFLKYQEIGDHLREKLEECGTEKGPTKTCGALVDEIDARRLHFLSQAAEKRKFFTAHVKELKRINEEISRRQCKEMSRFMNYTTATKYTIVTKKMF